jgi:hypothetical protein
VRLVDLAAPMCVGSRNRGMILSPIWTLLFFVLERHQILLANRAFVEQVVNVTKLSVKKTLAPQTVAQVRRLLEIMERAMREHSLESPLAHSVTGIFDRKKMSQAALVQDGPGMCGRVIWVLGWFLKQRQRSPFFIGPAAR